MDMHQATLGDARIGVGSMLGIPPSQLADFGEIMADAVNRLRWEETHDTFSWPPQGWQNPMNTVTHQPAGMDAPLVNLVVDFAAGSCVEGRVLEAVCASMRSSSSRSYN